MAKTSKKSKENAFPPSGPTPDSATNIPGKNGAGGPAIGKISATKSTKSTGQSRGAAKRGSRATGKTSRTGKPRAATAIGSSRRPRQVVISDDDIRLRAYFIAEQRMQTGMPGDSTHDWWEAHRQLLEETTTRQLREKAGNN
jgi:hypothetical protein